MKCLADGHLEDLCFVKGESCFYCVSLKHLKPTTPNPRLVSQYQFLREMVEKLILIKENSCYLKNG